MFFFFFHAWANNQSVVKYQFRYLRSSASTAILGFPQISPEPKKSTQTPQGAKLRVNYWLRGSQKTVVLLQGCALFCWDGKTMCRTGCSARCRVNQHINTVYLMYIMSLSSWLYFGDRFSLFPVTNLLPCVRKICNIVKILENTRLGLYSIHLNKSIHSV